jgi:hypothetical protein
MGYVGLWLFWVNLSFFVTLTTNLLIRGRNPLPMKSRLLLMLSSWPFRRGTQPQLEEIWSRDDVLLIFEKSAFLGWDSVSSHFASESYSRINGNDGVRSPHLPCSSKRQAGKRSFSRSHSRSEHEWREIQLRRPRKPILGALTTDGKLLRIMRCE